MCLYVGARNTADDRGCERLNKRLSELGLEPASHQLVKKLLFFCQKTETFTAV